MSIEIISKRIIALALGTILAVVAWSVVAAQQTPLAPVAQPPEVKEPAAVGLTVDTLKAMMAVAEASKDLSETDKKSVIGYLEAGIRLLEETDELNAEAQKITETVTAAPQRIKEIQAKLNVKDPAFSQADIEAAASQMTTAQIEQREREKRAALATARDTLKDWREQLEKLKNRPSQLQKEIAENKEKLAELADELKKQAPPNEPQELFRAREAAFLAEQSRRSAKIRLFEKQLLNNDLLVSLMTAEQDLATLQLKRNESESKAWKSIAGKRRQQEAVKARVEAETAKVLTPDLPPAIQKQYDTNIELGKTLEKITQDDALTAGMLEQRQTELKMLEEEFSLARQRIQSAALSEMSGITLRRRRQALPSPKRYRQNSEQRQLAMGHVSEAQFNNDEHRRSLLDLQDAKRRIIESISRESAENVSEWEDKLQTLLTDRRNLLKKLQTTYRRNYKSLQSLEFTEQQLAAKTEEYTNFLDGHLLWIRSSKVLGPNDLRNLPGALMWIASPSNWFQLVRDLAGSLRHSPMVFLLGLLSAGLLFIGRKWAWRKIEQLSESVGPVKRDSLMITVQAFGLTMYLAVAWPFLLILAGWRLAAFPYATDFSQAVGYGLRGIGSGWAVLLLMYYICHDRGLAQKHFRWSDISRMTLRRHLSWFMPLYLFCTFLATIIMAADQPAYTDSLGRLMFITATAAFAVFAVKMLPAVDANSPASRGDADNRRVPLKFIWYPLAIALPSLLVIMAVMGYYYSAYNLTRQFNNTVFLVIALILGNSLVLRWLAVAQRRLAYEGAIQKRQERLEAERARQSDPSHPTSTDGQQVMESFDIEEPEITRAQINEQTRSLLQTILFFSAVLGLWAIWDDVLPALNMFENATLWSYSVEVDGITRVMPITLINLMTAIVAAAITFIAARNLPGVLEISLLKYLPLDAGARYAFSTICQYAVSTVGIIITFNYIGISWSSLKWLVAALSVGIGFGLQEIVANFISGLIILFERPIDVGHLVTVANVDGTVTRMGIRATTITNWDRKEYLVPNKEFITGRVMNWTLSNSLNRVVISVGIAYGSDTEKALELLLKVAREHPIVLEDPAPLATFEAFGENALSFVLRCYLPNFDNWVINKTDLHLAIDKAFREAGITIAFPQSDVHFDTGRPLQVNITSEKQEASRLGDTQQV
jgi:potassium efflux system protein